MPSNVTLRKPVRSARSMLRPVRMELHEPSSRSSPNRDAWLNSFVSVGPPVVMRKSEG